MTLDERYEKWREFRYDHLGDIGFADVIREVMDYERWVIQLGEATSDERYQMIARKYRQVEDLIDDYEWDETFSEGEQA